MSEELKMFSVGDVVCQPSSDGVIFDLTNSGAVLMYKLSQPTANEKKQFKNGAFSAEIAVVDDIIFVLTRFGMLNWTDAPFNSKIMQAEVLPIPQKGQGLALHCVLIDSSSGVLVAQRFMGLSTELSQKLLELSTKQPDISDFYDRLDAIYKKYTTNQLVTLGKEVGNE